jgi:aminoglycoside phosphotransferase (APT) family kinase protein
MDRSMSTHSHEAEPTEARMLVDAQAFNEWADEKLPRLGSDPLQVEFLPGGGTSNIDLKVTRGGDIGVLRRPRRVPLPGSERILVREAQVLGALTGTGVPAPQLWASCPSQEPLGFPFYVMSFIDGWTPSRGERFPQPFDRPGRDRRNLAYELFASIGDLAKVDFNAVGLAAFGKPGDFLRRQVDRWRGQLASYREIEGYTGRELPGVDYVADWLSANTPETPRIGVLHGDASFEHTLFSRNAPTHLAALIDWELSTVGDPLLDLGWAAFTFSPRDGVPPPPGMSKGLDYPWREELVEFYADRAELPTNNINYYMILAQFKLATLLELNCSNNRIARTTLELIATAEQMARNSHR